MRIVATTAWLRGTVPLLLLAGAAAFLGRPDLAVLAVPLAVWTAWAVVARPRAVRVSRPPSSAAVLEGDDVDLPVRVDADRPVVVTLLWPDRPDVVPEAPCWCRTDLVDGAGAVSVPLRPRTWGTLELGPALVAVADPSGAWRAHERLDPVEVAVRPRQAPLSVPDAVTRPLGTAGEHLSPRAGDGFQLADVRPFQPGDRLRRLNWRATARRGVLHTNATLTERDTDVLVVADSIVDTAGPDPTGTTTLDTTAQAVLAVARHFLGRGDRVATVDLGSRLPSVPAGAGVRQARMLTEILARSRRGRARCAPGDPVARLRPGTLVLVCSPLLDDAAIAEVRRLHRLGGEVVVVDTLPTALGEGALDLADDATTIAEAWYLRFLERADVVRRLRDEGIPVARWGGPASLGAVLHQLAAARRAPRRSR